MRDADESGPEANAGTATGSDSAREDQLPADVEAVRRALVEWYEADHRAFPWRETDDAYEILVSEVMSQQTQLDRVVDAWHAFLEGWPTADDRLGYNNRARYLHEAARQVRDGEVGPADRPDEDGEPAEGGGEFPRDPDGLTDLMGVGPYTANAVASFAFDNGEAVVDTNVKRVLYRAFDVEDSDDAFERTASELMPAGESRVWNNAIMELGGVACEKTPACDEADCPWREWCSAYATGDFTAPDVPTQPEFEGSRRQKRGRVVAALSEHDELALDELGPKVRVDYVPDGEYGREWLRELLGDLADDELVDVTARDGETVAHLRR